MGKASSAKKVAKLAQSSANKKVRTSQGGRLFPTLLAAIVVLGVLLVVYARQSNQTSSAADHPLLNPGGSGGDHWHAAYGIYICDHFLTPIQNQSDQNKDGVTIGIHTHGDGAIHIHPFSTLSAGKNAKLGRFFDTTGMNMTSNSITLVEQATGAKTTYKNGDKCPNGKAGNVAAVVWNDAADTGKGTRYATDFSNIRFVNDRMAITLAFVPDDVDIPKPDVTILDKLGDVAGATTTTVAGDTTTVAGATTVPGATTTTASTTVPSTTVPPTTTTAAATSTSKG